MINIAAEQATKELCLSPSEFLPFAAAWPQVRAGYLNWLEGHERAGASFSESEAWKETPLGRLTLVGKIDRIDYLADGSALVMDYKTESPGITAKRIKDPLEDTQLAFYAALLSNDTLAAAYVNVGEKDGTKTYAQDDVVDLRDLLLEGIANDMGLIAKGAPMPALGEGTACDFCAARGLCRKDFWETP
jgi:ATP-dependent helicase/nuclease subunit B